MTEHPLWCVVFATGVSFTVAGFALLLDGERLAARLRARRRRAGRGGWIGGTR